MKNGESISNIYYSVCQRHCEKTESIMKLLGEENSKVEGVIADYIGLISNLDLNRILSIKGFKKGEIASILNKYQNHKH